MLSQFTSTTVCHDNNVAAFDVMLQTHQLLQPSQYLTLSFVYHECS